MTKFKFKKSRGYSFNICKSEDTLGCGFEFVTYKVPKSKINKLKRYLKKSLSDDIEIEEISNEKYNRSLAKLLRKFGLDDLDGSKVKYRLKIKNKADYAFFLILANDGIEI